MINPTTQSYSHSATVAAVLIVNGRRIGLSKISPDALFPAERVSIDPGEATVELQVDGKLRSWKVTIPHPVVPFDDQVTIRQV